MLLTHNSVQIRKAELRKMFAGKEQRQNPRLVDIAGQARASPASQGKKESRRPFA